MRLPVSRRCLLFLTFSAGTVLAFRGEITELVSLSLDREEYSYIMAMPVLSACLAYSERLRIRGSPKSSPILGVMLLGGSLLLVAAGRTAALDPIDRLSVTILSGVALWAGGIALFYGYPALRTVAFPLFLLLLTAPIPTFLLERSVAFLREGSTEVTSGIFSLVGTPVSREGFVFHLPGVTIEVAKQCSGIRSSLALLITSLVVGHCVLRTGWRRWAFSLAMIPLAVLKNGFRIAVLSLLAVHVDGSFITNSNLHRKGGILFFLLILLPALALLMLLRRSERRAEQGSGTDEPAGAPEAGSSS